LTMDHKCNCATGVQLGATNELHPPTPAGSTLGARRFDGAGTPTPLRPRGCTPVKKPLDIFDSGKGGLESRLAIGSHGIVL
jgi:hypothetical protein